MLILHLFVCVYEREVTGSHSTVTQTILFLCKATAGRYIMEPTSTASKSASSRLKESLLRRVVQKLDREVGLRVAASRLSRIEIVHGWFTEKHDSILGVFGSELLQVKLQNKTKILWLANLIGHVIW